MIKTKPKIAFKNILIWAIHLIKFIILHNKSNRFLVVSPPFFETQIIFDKKIYKFFSVNLRDIIDWCTLVQIFYDNDYGFEKFVRLNEVDDLYGDIINSGETPLILDCGANIGLATRFFSVTYEKSKIFCIEPDRENIRQARINNSEANVIFYEAAVGNIDMRGRTIDPGLGNWGYRIEGDENGDIEIYSINTLIKDCQQKNLRPFMVKIDIEGFERLLFSSNTQWMEEFPILIIELHDRMLPNTANSINFLKEISKLNRDFLYHGENIFSLSIPLQ
jgi:FkbM family methyltransferase